MSAPELAPGDPGVRLTLRHALATLAYRAGKTLRGTPEEFSRYRASADSPTVIEIVGHMADLMEWGLRTTKGEEKWTTGNSGSWQGEIARFYDALAAYDRYLASDQPIHVPPARLLQGGIADALTHTGQLAMLRRLSGHKMKGENYSRAEIQIGRVGLDQTPPDPRREFD